MIGLMVAVGVLTLLLARQQRQISVLLDAVAQLQAAALLLLDEDDETRQRPDA